MKKHQPSIKTLTDFHEQRTQTLHQSDKIALQIQEAVTLLNHGCLIAYPTEAVFGLGCLPDKTDTIKRLLNLKQRKKDKGLILLASEISQLEPYLCPVEQQIIDKIQSSWPGPNTWILPTPSQTSTLIKGNFETIAVRISAHPVVQALCSQCQSPLISTSANITGESMSYSVSDVQKHFGNSLDFILDAPLGNSNKPSVIRDALTDQVLRN